MKKEYKNIIEIEKELNSYEGVDRIISSHELADTLGDVDKFEGYSTGINGLDTILGEGAPEGVEVGELVVVTGLTGEGKTTILTSITQNMAEQDINTAWFTLEVTPRQFIKKIKKSGGRVPLFYLPRQNTDEPTIHWIEKRIIEAQIKYNTKVIFIDHIHGIYSLHKNTGKNVSLEIGDMVSKVKDIAVRRGVAIFLVAHCKDAPAGSPHSEPTKEWIRDSGLISRFADTILGVWRVSNSQPADNRRPNELNEDDTASKVRVMKNRRNGRLGTVYMKHNNARLIETTEEELIANSIDKEAEKIKKEYKKVKKEIDEIF